jgi:dimethyl sulfoxide reductase iron-sulfur subunit
MTEGRTPGTADASHVNTASAAKLAVVVDLRRCTGCQSCTIACKAENGTPPGVFWTRVISKEEGSFPAAHTIFMPMRCNHCGDPPCVSVCPTGASHKREKDGIVLVDQERCVGCHSCVVTCPYQARFIPEDANGYYGEKKTPYEEARYGKWRAGATQKCTLCVHRIDRGLNPACVETCPTKALVFGDLNDPQSAVSELLRTRAHFQPRAELGTDPRVFYLT